MNDAKITDTLTKIPHNTQKTNEEAWKEVSDKKRNRNRLEKTTPHKQPKMDSYWLSNPMPTTNIT